LMNANNTTVFLYNNYELANDIDMTGFISSSIGHTDPNNGFTGSFDGKGYTVTIYVIDSSNYSGFFSATDSLLISNLTIVYKNDNIIIGDGGLGLSGGFVAEGGGNISNCHVILGNNVTIGDNDTLCCGGFAGSAVVGTLSNCSLTVGNNLSINSTDFSGGFIGDMNGSTLSDCNIIIGNDAELSGPDVGGIVGSADNMNRISLTVGQNCIMRGENIGAIAGENDNNTSIENCKVIFKGDVTIIGTDEGSVGGIGGKLEYQIINSIVLFGENTYITGNSLVGGAFGVLTDPSSEKSFAIYKNYSIKGGTDDAIVPGGALPSILTQSCGIPLPGSDVINMSTTSLSTIIAFLQTIPYLQDLIPYILQTYCVVALIIELVCPCIADLCTSNPQVTNYNESEDKSRRADQLVRRDFDVKLAEINNGTRVSPMPIFKTYHDVQTRSFKI